MLEENQGAIREGGLKKVFAKTFLWMFMGLLATGIIAYFTYSTGYVYNLVNEGTFAIVCLVELVVVLLFSFLMKKLPPMAVSILYFVYAIINGITLSTIFVVFQMESIFLIFLVSAAVFGIFAFLGYKTKIDLSKIGTICYAALFAGIILTLLNMIFFHSSFISIGLDWIILLVFFGVTAYDIQKIKKLYDAQVLDQEKLHIYCAMDIYLDFINIFIRLLSLFGKRK